ncbi:MAG: MBL fold metallo-hydrolase [Oscillospiraceae bacterium]|nr:MBL fold metallo-hydrolase [Oscillospiraceae bacterium]
MEIIKLPPMSNFGVNSYIITAENMNGVLIDAPYGGESIITTLMEKGIELKKILLTHGHCDHIAAAARIAKETGAKIYIHKFDEDKLHNDRTNLTQFFSLPPIDPVENAVTVSDGEVIEQDELEFEVLHTPGHTSGSVCYLLGDNMFSGDTLFNGSMGRTDMVDGNDDVMSDTLKMLYEFDRNTNYTVYPGHGASTSMVEERQHNPYLRYAAGLRTR